HRITSSMRYNRKMKYTYRYEYVYVLTMTASYKKVASLFSLHFPGESIPKMKPITTMKGQLWRNGVISSTSQRYTILKGEPEFPELDDILFNILQFYTFTRSYNDIMTVSKQWSRVLSNSEFWK